MIRRVKFQNSTRKYLRNFSSVIGTIGPKFPKSYHHDHLQRKKHCYSVYAWGTSKYDSIPLTQSEKTSEEGGGGATSLLKSSNVVYDNPKYIDMLSILNLDATQQKKVSVEEFQCGNDKSAVILSDGSCYTWGHNYQGQLGLGHADNVTSPTLVELSSTTSMSSISLHSVFSACVASDTGDLYTFGSNGSAFQDEMGFLGHGDENNYYTPKLVESLVEDGCSVSHVALGSAHMAVVTTEGELLTAGAGSYGRLGNLEPINQLYLEPVELLANQEVVQVDVGNAFSLALTSDGILHGWGRNDKGQLGDGGSMMVDMYAMENLPRPIEGQLEGRMVVKVATGYAHAACITDKGELFLWGMSQSLEPMLVPSMLDKKCIDVACGQNYTLILTEDGQLYSMGKGKTGVLGHANTSNLNEPELVEGLLDKKVVKMSAGYTHCAVLVEDDESN